MLPWKLPHAHAGPTAIQRCRLDQKRVRHALLFCMAAAKQAIAIAVPADNDFLRVESLIQ
jgi:hypothetical protein